MKPNKSQCAGNFVIPERTDTYQKELLEYIQD